MYEARVVVQGISDPKTFFPAHWTREQVIVKICEAMQNIEKTIESGNRLVLTGKTQEGMYIKLVIEKLKIISAYPVLEV